MARFKPGGSLSSRDPSTKPIAVRLPADLLAAIDDACKAQGITQSELLRGLVSQWVYGTSQLAGPDEGYAQARSMASQLAIAAVKRALEELPKTHGEAATMLQGIHDEHSAQRKKQR